jgi:hypothetical protein
MLIIQILWVQIHLLLKPICSPIINPQGSFKVTHRHLKLPSTHSQLKLKKPVEPGVVAHAYNPSYLGGRNRRMSGQPKAQAQDSI